MRLFINLFLPCIIFSAFLVALLFVIQKLTKIYEYRKTKKEAFELYNRIMFSFGNLKEYYQKDYKLACLKSSKIQRELDVAEVREQIYLMHNSILKNIDMLQNTYFSEFIPPHLAVSLVNVSTQVKEIAKNVMDE